MIMPPTPYDDNPLWGCHLALAEYTEAGEWAQLLRTINEGDHRGATTTYITFLVSLRDLLRRYKDDILKEWYRAVTTTLDCHNLHIQYLSTLLDEIIEGISSLSITSIEYLRLPVVAKVFLNQVENSTTSDTLPPIKRARKILRLLPPTASRIMNSSIMSSSRRRASTGNRRIRRMRRRRSMSLSPYTNRDTTVGYLRDSRSDVDDDVDELTLPYEEDIITMPGGSSTLRRASTGSVDPHSIQGDEVEEEEEEGPSKWIEGARGLGGSDIGVLSLGYAVGICVRYLSTSLKSTVEALHSISSKDLQTYLMSINDDLLLQGGHHQDYWSTIAKSGRELKEGHRRDVVIGNGVGVAHRVDNDCDINGDVLMGSVGVEGEVGGGSSSSCSSPVNYTVWKDISISDSGGGCWLFEVYCDTILEDIRSKWLSLLRTTSMDSSVEGVDRVLIGMYEVVSSSKNTPIRRVAEELTTNDHHPCPTTSSIWSALDRILDLYKDDDGNDYVLSRVCRMNLYWWWSQLIYHVHRERYHTTTTLSSLSSLRLPSNRSNLNDLDSVLPSDCLFTFPNGRLNIDSCTQVPQLALIIGRYRIIRYVGCGGFARGFIGIDNDPQSLYDPVDVFIKIFYSSKDSPMGTRPNDNEIMYRINEVEKELTLSERLLQCAPRLMNSECFVRILAVHRGVKMECPLNNNTQGRVSAVITELCYGGNLKEIMDRHNTTPFSTHVRSCIARDLRSLIQCLYGSDDINDRYYHGDIKCDNLLVGRREPRCNGRIKLADYGSIIRLTSLEAPKKYEHSTHEYVHPNGPSIYPMVVDVWSVALVLLIIHVHAYGPTFNDIVDIIRKHQKVHWGALLALVHGEEKNILSPLLMNLIDISFDIRDDINDFINHPYFLKEVLPSITDHGDVDMIQHQHYHASIPADLLQHPLPSWPMLNLRALSKVPAFGVMRRTLMEVVNNNTIWDIVGIYPDDSRIDLDLKLDDNSIVRFNANMVQREDDFWWMWIESNDDDDDHDIVWVNNPIYIDFLRKLLMVLYS